MSTEMRVDWQEFNFYHLLFFCLRANALFRKVALFFHKNLRVIHTNFSPRPELTNTILLHTLWKTGEHLSSIKLMKVFLSNMTWPLPSYDQVFLSIMVTRIKYIATA